MKQHFDRPIASFLGNIEPVSLPVNIVIVHLNVVQYILPSHLAHKFPIQLFHLIFIQNVYSLFFEIVDSYINCFVCLLSP